MLVVRNPDVEVAPLKDELLLYCSKTGKFFVMNDTAAFLWQRLGSPVHEQELAEQLRNTFSGVSAEQALADVKHTLGELLAHGLVRADDTPASTA